MPDNSTYRDYIPANEDPGPIGKDGYQDYVPAPEPKPQVVTEPEPVVPTPEPVKPEPTNEPAYEQSEQPTVPPLDGGNNGS